MFFTFVLLYLGILHKTHALVEENVMKKEVIEARYGRQNRTINSSDINDNYSRPSLNTCCELTP